MPRKYEDLVGKKFGKLEVVKFYGLNKHNQRLWLCKCECGSDKDIIATSSSLKHGHYVSCGCRKKKDLTGKKFNHLTAMYPINDGSRTVTWHWKCDCGNEVDIKGTYVSNGYRKSCGKCKMALHEYLDSIRVDYTGKEFDGFEVVERLPTLPTKSVPYRCICKHCGNEFIVTDHALRQNCVRSCGCTYGSSLEKEVATYISEIYSGKILRNYSITGDRHEVDIYIPEHNLAIDVNGSFIHSDLGNKFMPKSNTHHLDRYIEAKNLGVHLINLFDIDWSDKVKSILHDYLVPSVHIFARKCECKEVKKDVANEFLELYHLSGGSRNSKFHFGLYYNGELISVMSFGIRRFCGGIEIMRYAVKHGLAIVGGANKLFRHFIEAYSIDEVFTYSDNDYFTGDVYRRLGFDFISYTDPSYYWYNGHKGALKREQCQPKKLIEKYPELYDPNAKSVENDIMLKLKYCRVHRAGNSKWLWKRGDTN